MATKSVFQIEVDDGQWKKFQDSFKDFQNALKQTSADTKGIGGGFAGISGATANAWRDLARDSKSVADHISSATSSLLKWGTIIGGLVGVGSLWGLDRLANVAGNLRRSSLGLGASPGELRGFAGAYGRVVDPNQVLGGVNAALHDVTRRVGLYGAGLTEGDLRGKDTGEVANELIPALKKIADQTPESMLAQVLQARHLDQFINLEDFKRLKHTSPVEIAGYQEQYQKQRQTLELTQQQQKAWQDLSVQLHFAGMSIETTLIRGLAPLAPNLGRLSEAFRGVFESLLHNKEFGHWIDEAAAGLGTLAHWVGSPKFSEDVQTFVTDIGRMASAIGKAIGWIASWFPDAASPGGGAPGTPGDGAKPNHSYKLGWPSWLPELGSPYNPAHNWDPFGMGSGAVSGTFLDAVRTAETGNNPNQTSPTGAQGPYQFMPGTWAQYGQGGNPFDPVASRAAASRYFAKLSQEFGGDTDKMLAAYNWGEGNVEKDLSKYGSAWREHLPREARRYIDQINKQVAGAGQYQGDFKDRSVQVRVTNQTGGNANVSVSQLAAQWS